MVSHLARDATDAEILLFIDQWICLMEAEDYEAAYAYTAHSPSMGWTPALIRQVVKSYDECLTTQRITLEGRATDVHQHKEVHRYPASRFGSIGYVWYDLNVDHVVSDLTATFDLQADGHGLMLVLNDIHVM